MENTACSGKGAGVDLCFAKVIDHVGPGALVDGLAIPETDSAIGSLARRTKARSIIC